MASSTSSWLLASVAEASSFGIHCSWASFNSLLATCYLLLFYISYCHSAK